MVPVPWKLVPLNWAIPFWAVVASLMVTCPAECVALSRTTAPVSVFRLLTHRHQYRYPGRNTRAVG